MTRRLPLRTCVASALALTLAAVALRGDDSREAQALGRAMLRSMHAELRRLYYDPDFRGHELDALFHAAETRIDGTANEAQVGAILGQVLLPLHDSHTYFIPPMHPYVLDYGFELRMVGAACRVLRVRAGSDAAANAVRPGDAVLSIEGAAPDRRSFAEIEYALWIAAPRPELHLSLAAPGQPAREVVVRAKVERRRKSIDVQEWFDEVSSRRRPGEPLWRLFDLGAGVELARLSSFNCKDDAIADLTRHVSGKQGLILDLRGNPGGSVDALRALAGALFPDEIELAELRARHGMKPLRSKRPGAKHRFSGRLVVLVDAASASASEILARVVQLERRGRVVGDRSSGAVMVSERVFLSAGDLHRLVPFGVSVTTADVLMKDGSSLEGQGVTPDELLLPSAADLRAGRDPVLSRAAELLGVSLDAARAARLLAWKAADR